MSRYAYGLDAFGADRPGAPPPDPRHIFKAKMNGGAQLS